MTTTTHDAAAALGFRPVRETARPPGGAAPASRVDAPGAGAPPDDPPVLVFFDGLADARELAAWGAWRRDRG